MSKLNFFLIGYGAVAQYHRKAIEHVGGKIRFVFDPKYTSRRLGCISLISQHELIACDYFVIASPSYLHRSQIKFLLSNVVHDSAKIICEKPAFLPWEPIIDDDRINIVLQLRYLTDLPEKADLVKATFVRDKEYFKTWKGNPKKTGGLFFNLFIHYIDLAIQLNADFEGMVLNEGEQERFIVRKKCPERHWDNNSKIDILNIDMQGCYNRLYEDIISGNGIKPSDLFYLSWILQRNSEIFGYGKNGMNKPIKIGRELL